MNARAMIEPEFEPRFEPRHMQHRRNARVCGLLAEDAASPIDRWTLLTMQQSWLALAENEEWLAGRCAVPGRHGATGLGSTGPKSPGQTAYWGS